MTINLALTGAMPTRLSGQYVCLGDVLHVVRLVPGRVPSYRSSSELMDATNVVAFGSSVLAFGDRKLAREFDAELTGFRRVDLAGAHRLTGLPKVDTNTGELHLVAYAGDSIQLHVRVSSGGL